MTTAAAAVSVMIIIVVVVTVMTMMIIMLMMVMVMMMMMMVMVMMMMKTLKAIFSKCTQLAAPQTDSSSEVHPGTAQHEHTYETTLTL